MTQIVPFFGVGGVGGFFCVHLDSRAKMCVGPSSKYDAARVCKRRRQLVLLFLFFFLLTAASALESEGAR